jgi:hypothetical protein
LKAVHDVFYDLGVSLGYQCFTIDITSDFRGGHAGENAPVECAKKRFEKPVGIVRMAGSDEVQNAFGRPPDSPGQPDR